MKIFMGAELKSITYERIFAYFKDHANSFKILLADYVTTEDGTGVVHQAPGFREDDMATTAKYGIELVMPVDDDGKFTSLTPEYEGQLVFDANKDIIRDLKVKGRDILHVPI